MRTLALQSAVLQAIIIGFAPILLIVADAIRVQCRRFNIGESCVLLGCGDSLFDMFIGEADVAGNNGDDTRISVEGVVGGSPMNVALGMARLGHVSRYLTKLSNDPFGQRIARFLSNNNIDHSLSIPTKLYSTLAMVETQADGSAQYAFYINNTADVSLTADELPAELPADVRILHFASYSTAVEPVRSSLSALAARESAQRVVSYDPNLRLSIEPDVQQWQASFCCRVFSKRGGVGLFNPWTRRRQRIYSRSFCACGRCSGISC